MTLLLGLKLFLAPLFVGLATYIQRRWGDGVGGRLIGLPLTTGPFIFIIYIQNGAHFAARAVHGVLMGQVALIVFCWVYALAVFKMRWLAALLTASAACITVGALLTSLEITLIYLLSLLVICWLVAIYFWPGHVNRPRTAETPRWELPARLVVTVLLILTLTGAANALGPRVAGALSTYPVIISVLGAFNQRRHGPDSTVATLRGLMQSLPITIGIMTTLALVL